MPITKSAKKSLKVSRAKRARNLILEAKLKKSLKKVSKSSVSETISLIDKTAKRHVISRGRADRLKSRITKKFGTPKQEKREKKIEKAKTATQKKKTVEKLKPVAKSKTSAKK